MFKKLIREDKLKITTIQGKHYSNNNYGRNPTRMSTLRVLQNKVLKPFPVSPQLMEHFSITLLWEKYSVWCLTLSQEIA